MKKLLISLSAFALLACSEESKTDTSNNVTTQIASFGEEITEEGAISVEQMLSQLNNRDSLTIKVSGVIDEVCQAKGCWMDIKVGEDDYFTVKFKDYGFFVPKDVAGKETIFEGVAFTDTISVADLIHKAQDAQEPDSVINAITEPEINIGFIASGVIIKD